MDIGKAMKVIREDCGLSRRDMASKLGCTTASLWKIENGRVWPKKSTIDKFCELLGAPQARLYTTAFEKEDFVAR